MMNPADIQAVAAAMGVFKTGLDTVRSALGALKDAKELLPVGNQKEELTGALERATDQIRAGEAALASALGYSLCRCSFPPVPRLLAGYLLLGHIPGRGDDRKLMLERLMDQQKVGACSPVRFRSTSARNAKAPTHPDTNQSLGVFRLRPPKKTHLPVCPTMGRFCICILNIVGCRSNNVPDLP
jgi:hypothetical protein